jgi:hypothetical protein
MAITEIITTEGVPMEHSFTRGNIGVLTDMQGAKLNEFAMPAGGGAGAVFPSVGDVDQGVDYGPTGADYTGTLVQPDEADVALGVQYGAGGAEFEGTLVGGGASEHSYPFVI